MESNILKFHKYIMQFLNPKMANFYQLIYVENLKDDQVSQKLKERIGRGITKRQLIEIKNTLQQVAKSKISEFDPES